MSLLPKRKTKIICTIGPVSQSPDVLERMVRSGMDVARLNLAHGDLDSHQAAIARVRAAAAGVGRRVALMADLPGPKLRVGTIEGGRFELTRGQDVRLVAGQGTDPGASSATAADAVGESRMKDDIPVVPLPLPSLPAALRPGKEIFLNDGLIELRLVDDVHDDVVMARVVVGGELRSHDGASLPGIDLGISAFTERDRELLAFALDEGADAVAVSFVQGPDDVLSVRDAARSLGHSPLLVAKIERSKAVERIDDILEVSDGLMVARGDLGVEIPVERVAVVQKSLIGRANAAARPVITATQMLESMTHNRRPTRAEVSDVSNAVLDGTDCVMLSEETAMGMFPVEAVSVMAAVTSTTERYLNTTHRPPADATSIRGVLAQETAVTAERLDARYILVPTETGTTARAVAKLRPRSWVIALSGDEKICQQLQFSRGVYPVLVPKAGIHPDGAVCGEIDWHAVVRRWMAAQKLEPGLAVMIQGNNRLEVVELDGAPVPD